MFIFRGVCTDYEDIENSIHGIMPFDNNHVSIVTLPCINKGYSNTDTCANVSDKTLQRHMPVTSPIIPSLDQDNTPFNENSNSQDVSATAAAAADVPDISNIIKCTGPDAALCNGQLCCILNSVVLSPLPIASPSPLRTNSIIESRKCRGSAAEFCDCQVCCFINEVELSPLPPVTPPPLENKSPLMGVSCSSSASTMIFSPVLPPEHIMGQCPIRHTLDCFLCNLMLVKASF